ncbi:MAG: glycine cleavage system protein GcvH [Cyanobacteria bacterium P01_A01_bin.135]
MALDYPDHLTYFDSHEYAELVGDVVTLGISAFAVDELGDIVFLELPEVGDSVSKGETFGTVESVKAVEDLVSPVTGAVVERNDDLLESPENLSEDTYEAGWMVKVKIKDSSELDDGLTAEEYRDRVEGDEDEIEAEDED